MNYCQSHYLARLQDLKVWQVNYDSILQNKSKNSTRASDYETIEGLSALDSSTASVEPTADNTDWDKKAISPTKPFAQLLEEKLAEDEPIQVQPKPKKPFLRKGAGLLRYKLGPRAVTATKPLRAQRKPNRPKSASPNHSIDLKHTADANTEPEVCMIPLKMPDASIKPTATWSKFVQNLGTTSGTKHQAREEEELPHMSSINNKTDFRQIHSRNLENRQHCFKNDNRTKNEVQIQTSLENTLERDLRIFETLEERVEHPSFSSTNSSIIKMLVSTPRKLKTAFRKASAIEETTEMSTLDREAVIDNPILAQKIEETNKKSNLLHEFLENLKMIADDNQMKKQWIYESRQPKAEERLQESTDTSYSESSPNIDTRSQSPSSFYTDFENTLKDSHIRRVDAAVNTSFTEVENSKSEETCKNCEELRKSLENLRREIPDIQKEKAKICDFAKDLEKKRDQLSIEIQKQRDKYDRDVNDLREELAAEKKKFAKEKALFDMYIKESQNRPTKKEREEIASLKKELTDTKELLKLKEVKNGATQARLRNQIKQLEKEKSDLKASVESLQKENSKLIAAQKLRRPPSEVKMLHEINKNLTKLTEETFKKQVTKSDISNDLKTDEKHSRSERTLSEDDLVQRNKETPKHRRRSASSKQRTSGDYIVDENQELSSNMTNFVDLSLEKEYENVFGNSPKPEMQTTNMNDSKKDKTETVFPDGSKQIKYSNGNSKTISPDGKLIVVQYYNGDIKETNIAENILKYYYAQNDTWQTQYEDGSELLEYANGQKEKRFRDGRKEITCPDGTQFIKTPEGVEEALYPDGSKMVKTLDGNRILYLPNGQKEIHTNDHKRREYPDGTVKILYPDGTQETRYASGRIRIKDANGVLLMDSQS